MRYLLSLLAVLAFVGTAQADEPKRLTDAEMDQAAAGFYPGYSGIGSYDSAAARAYYQAVRSDLDALSVLLRSIY